MKSHENKTLDSIMVFIFLLFRFANYQILFPQKSIKLIYFFLILCYSLLMFQLLILLKHLNTFELNLQTVKCSNIKHQP